MIIKLTLNINNVIKKYHIINNIKRHSEVSCALKLTCEMKFFCHVIVPILIEFYFSDFQFFDFYNLLRNNPAYCTIKFSLCSWHYFKL